MKRVGLKAKFILLIIGVLTLIFTLIALFLVRFTTSTLRTDLNNESRAFASLATDPIGAAYVLYQDSGRVRILQQIEKFTDLDKNISNVAIIDNTGKILFDQHELTSKVNISEHDASSFDPIYVSNNNSPSRIISPYLENFGGHRYSVVYDISSKAINQAVEHVALYTLILALCALLITAFLLYRAINRFFLIPLQHLSTTAILISQGDLSKDIALESHDEIADLAVSVNAMAASLKADITKLQDVDKLKTEFMMITSHNLRTPLTIIRGYLETIATFKLQPEIAKLISIISANSERLHILAEDILTISQIEAKQELSFDVEPIDLTALVHSISNECIVLAKEKKIAFSADLPEHTVNINGSASHLRSALWNVLDNALKFTHEGGIIKLTLATGDNQALIKVQDTGIGIAPEEMNKLFTKFHRGTSTLNYNYEGVGIGLYISKLIIKHHNGDITAASGLGQGSTFVINIPLIQS